MNQFHTCTLCISCFRETKSLKNIVTILEQQRK